MPLHPNAGSGVSIQDSICFGCLPVVEVKFAALVTRNQELTIVAEVNRTGVTCTIMAIKLFSTDPPKVSALVLVDDYLVIRRLSSVVLIGRVHGCSSNCVHFRF